MNRMPVTRARWLALLVVLALVTLAVKGLVEWKTGGQSSGSEGAAGAGGVS